MLLQRVVQMVVQTACPATMSGVPRGWRGDPRREELPVVPSLTGLVHPVFGSVYNHRGVGPYPGSSLEVEEPQLQVCTLPVTRISLPAKQLKPHQALK